MKRGYLWGQFVRGREGWREGGRKGGREGGREGGRMGGREGGRDGGREGGRRGWMAGEREAVDRKIGKEKERGEMEWERRRF